MRILVNGSSISNGAESWPSILRETVDCELINLSLAGAGNNYIADTTIAELSERSYDLVLVMWTEFNRYDFKLSKVDQYFAGQYFTSATQSAIDTDIVSEPYIQKDWVFGSAYLTKETGAGYNINAVFDGYYRFVNVEQQMFNSLIKMISLQSVLTSLNVPYIFMSFKPMVGLHRFAHLYKMINWDNVYNKEHLHTLAINNKWWDESTDHPTPDAHHYYANQLIQRIEQSTGYLARRT
jgi:hypothetical protein